MLVLCQILGKILTPWIHGPAQANVIQNYPPDSSVWDLIARLSIAIAAGSEELAYVALPVLILTAAGFKQRWIWPIAILSRLSFHLYYFPDMLGLVFWATGTLILYRLTGNLLGMIAAHILWDIALTLIEPPETQVVGVILFTALLGTSSIYAFWRLVRRTEPASQSPGPTQG